MNGVHHTPSFTSDSTSSPLEPTLSLNLSSTPEVIYSDIVVLVKEGKYSKALTEIEDKLPEVFDAEIKARIYALKVKCHYEFEQWDECREATEH